MTYALCRSNVVVTELFENVRRAFVQVSIHFIMSGKGAKGLSGKVLYQNRLHEIL